MRLIAIVMGTRSDNARMVESQKLLTYGFRYFQTHQLYSVNDEVSKIRVWSGKTDELSLGVAEDTNLTLPRGAQDKLQAQMHIDKVIKAPIKLGQEIGKITIDLDGEQILELPLVAKQEIEQAGFFARTWDSIKLFFMNLFGLL